LVLSIENGSKLKAESSKQIILFQGSQADRDDSINIKIFYNRIFRGFCQTFLEIRRGSYELAVDILPGPVIETKQG
jgi:hypothetical protein